MGLWLLGAVALGSSTVASASPTSSPVPGPTSKPSSRPNAKHLDTFSCIPQHLTRPHAQVATADLCASARLSQAEGRSLKWTRLKGLRATLVGNGCQFTLAATASNKRLRCSVSYHGIRYQSQPTLVANVLKSLRVVITDRTEGTQDLRYERLIMVYRLLERSRTFVSAVDALFVLENRGKTTVDCRTRPFLLPMLAPKAMVEVGLGNAWLAQDYAATRKNPKAIRDIIVRGPPGDAVIVETGQGFVFKGVLRPGVSVSFTQHALRMPQKQTAITMMLTAAFPVGVAVLRTARSRFYTPLLSVNGVTSTKLDTHRGVTYHAVVARQLDQKRALQLRVSRLPVPTDHAVWLAFYSIVALGVFTVIVLIVFEVRRRSGKVDARV